jgi:hypothetical protein
VYSGLTTIPSGVTQFKASTLPAGADLPAAFFQASRFAESANAALFALDMTEPFKKSVD